MFYFVDEKILIIYKYFLFLILTLCMWTDVRYKKIYNAVTFPLFIGMVLSIFFLENGFLGLSLKGFGIAFFALTPFFFLRILGAGDIKLMLAFSLIMPQSIFWEWVWWSFIVTAIAGVVLLFYHRRTKIFFEKLLLALKCLLVPGLQAHIPQLSFEIQWPFGVALWMAYLKIWWSN